MFLPEPASYEPSSSISISTAGKLQYKMLREVIVLDHKMFVDMFMDCQPERWHPKDFLASIVTPATETQMYDTLVREAFYCALFVC